MHTPARQLLFLGTGTSVGVPMVGCSCAVCTSPQPRNQRYRSSVLLATPAGNILVDTSPELRLQLLREKIPLVHAVLYTHYHADHFFGLDDLRPFPPKLGAPIPIYCTDEVEERIMQTFSYAFNDSAQKMPLGSVPKLEIRRIADKPFTVLGQKVTPIPLQHAQFNVLGFRLDDLAYCTDVNFIPESSWPLLYNLEVLVLDALRFRPHPAHFTVEEALAVIERVKPKRAYLTHISHDIDHDTTSKQLPTNVALAYDGLRIAF